MKVAISVLVPVYNTGSYLQEALESVINQSFKPKEIIIIDDGSTVDISNFVPNHRSISLFQRPHLGVSAALNFGISKARSKWIAFLDADDLWMPDKLQIQKDFATQNPHFQAVFGRMSFFSSTELSGKIHIPESPQEGLHRSCFFVENSVFEKIGLFNEDYQKAEFIEWMARFQDFGLQYGVPPEVVAKRRLHLNGLSGNGEFGDFTRMLKSRLDKRRKQ